MLLFWRPMHSAQCTVPPFARQIPSVCDKSEHCENGER